MKSLQKQFYLFKNTFTCHYASITLNKKFSSLVLGQVVSAINLEAVFQN